MPYINRSIANAVLDASSDAGDVDHVQDRLATTYWWSTVATGTAASWIEIDYGSGNAYPISRLGWYCHTFSSAGTYAPEDMRIYGSNNGSDWDLLDTLTGITIDYAEKNTNYIDFTNSTSYRYYKLYIDETQTANKKPACYELMLFEEITDSCSSWSSDKFTGGTADSQYESGSHPIEDAFDDSLSSYWESNSYSTSQWIEYDLGSGNETAAERFGMNSTATINRTPWSFQLYGHNGGAETLLLTVTFYNHAFDAWAYWIFENSTAYRYYKVYIQGWRDETGYPRIAEVSLFTCSIFEREVSESATATDTIDGDDLKEVQTENITATDTVDGRNIIQKGEISESAQAEDAVAWAWNPIGNIGPIVTATDTFIAETNSEIFTEFGTIADYVEGEPRFERENLESATLADSCDAFNWGGWFATYGHLAKIRYYLTLTGDADSLSNAVLPMSYFQIRKQTGLPTYLSAVVPGSQYETIINNRSNGDLIVEMAYFIDDSEVFREQICYVDLTEIRIDKGASKRSITLIGSRTITYVQQRIELTGASYKNISANGVRYRFGKTDPYVNAGDSIVVTEDNDYTFTSAVVTMMVSPTEHIMEISSY